MGKGGGKGKGGHRKKGKYPHKRQRAYDADKEGEDQEGKRAKLDPDDWTQVGYTNEPWKLENAQFEAYYRKQGICPESEWPKFLEALRTGLPAAIRVNPTRPGAAALNSRLAELQRTCAADAAKECYAPRGLPWYPKGNAWQWDALERRTIKKERAHRQIKQYLLAREKHGLISRQEAVSMIPPLFLQAGPHDLVLDMCAAPGSKTSQIIESMHWAHALGEGEAPRGLVVGNDVQWKRANMLAHQVQRLNSPCTAIINVDAQFLPQLFEANGGPPLLFDRVLCDVPCSGDGTMRKSPSIWRSWTVKDGLGLHIRQFNILSRGIDALKIGGRLVYSTCTFNPLEDESVVAAALLKYGDTIKLVIPPTADGLQGCEGLQTWVVPDPEQQSVFYESYADVPQELKSTAKQKLLPSMFPPEDANSSRGPEVRKELLKCRRFLPHLMNTGGFFVTVFEKVANFEKVPRGSRKFGKWPSREGGDPGESAAEATADVVVSSADAPNDEAKTADVETSKTEKKDVEDEVKKPAAQEQASKAVPSSAGSKDKDKPLRKIATGYPSIADEDPADWRGICQFYGLDESLGQRVVFQTDTERKLFLISEGLLRILRAEARLATRFVECGVCVLKKGDWHFENAPSWGITQEGVSTLVAFGLKRRIGASQAICVQLLKKREVVLSELRKAEAAGEVSGLASITSSTGQLLPGSLAVSLQTGEKLALPEVVIAASATDTAIEASATPAQTAALLDALDDNPEDILGTVEADAADEDKAGSPPNEEDDPLM